MPITEKKFSCKKNCTALWCRVTEMERNSTMQRPAFISKHFVAGVWALLHEGDGKEKKQKLYG